MTPGVLALALPDAVEQDHHGRPSFRVGGKIFATLWDDEHVNVMLDEAESTRRSRSIPTCAPNPVGQTPGRRSRPPPGRTTRALGRMLEESWELRAHRRR